MSFNYSIKETCWQDDEDCIRAIRTEVFIIEQHVPEELEWDELDNNATHLLTYDHQQHCCATLRMLDDGHIGRVAVLKPYRNQGIAREMMNRAIILATQRDLPSVVLNAQKSIVPLYQSLGFICEGNEFIDAGIPHIKMRKELAPDK